MSEAWREFLSRLSSASGPRRVMNGDGSIRQSPITSRSGRLRRIAYVLTGDWSTAEDLVQTTLARAWQAWRRIKGDPDPYVYRILTNTHASWWRRRWRGRGAHRVPPDTTARGDFARELSEKDALWTAIRGLSDRQRRSSSCTTSRI